VAIAYVRDSGKQQTSNATSDSYTWGTNPTVNNHVFGVSGMYSGALQLWGAQYSDNQTSPTNTYTRDARCIYPPEPSPYIKDTISSCKIAKSSGTFITTIVGDGSGGGPYPFYANWCLVEFSGIAATSWFDQTTSGVDVGGGPTTDASVTAAAQNSQADMLAIAVCELDINDSTLNCSTPTDYTELYVENDGTTITGGQASYRILTSQVTSSASWSHDNHATDWNGWTATIATYKAAGAAGYTVSVDQAVTVADVPTAALATVRLTPSVADTSTVTDVPTVTLSTGAVGSKDLCNETWNAVSPGGYAFTTAGTGRTDLNAWVGVLGSGSTLDADSTDITDPLGGSSHLLKVDKVSPNFNSRARWRTAGDNAISYSHFWVYIAAEGLADGQNVDLFSAQNTAFSTVYTVKLNQTSGSLGMYLSYYNNGSAQTSVVGTTTSTGVWYRIEVYYDDTNNLWAWRRNGIEIGSGSLTGTHYTGPRDFRCGDGDNARAVTLYFDDVNVSTDGWQTSLNTVAVADTLSITEAATVRVRPIPATFYIDPAGSDDASGLATDAAWATIAKVNAQTLYPDDQILFKRGETWRETLTVPSSGTSGHPIVFGTYGSGADPIIRGSTVVTNWETLGGNRWQASSTTGGPIWFVALTTNVITRGIAQTTVDDVVAEYDYYASGTAVVVYAASDPDTRYATVEAGMRANAVNVNAKSYITVQDLDVGLTTGHALLVNGSHATVTGCSVHHAGFIRTYPSDAVCVKASDAWVTHCTISEAGEHGVHLWAGTGETVENGVVEDNVIFNCYWGQIDCKGSGTGVSQNHIIRRNSLSTTAAYQDFSLNGPGVVVGCLDATASVSGIEISYNQIVHLAGTGINVYDYADDVIIANNTIGHAHASYTGSGVAIIVDGDAIANVTITNNIGVDMAGGVFLSNSTQILNCDYNLWYESIGGTQWYASVDGAYYHYNDQAVYKSDTGFDEHGLWIDPLFSDPDNDDFTLQLTSPGRNAGVDVGLTADLLGHLVPVGSAPDIGAYEYQLWEPALLYELISVTDDVTVDFSSVAATNWTIAARDYTNRWTTTF